MRITHAFCKYLYKENNVGIIFLRVCSLSIILVSYLLTPLNAQAIMPCKFCGVGTFEKIECKKYFEFIDSEVKLCSDENKLLNFENTFMCKETEPVSFKQSDKQFLVKCSYCAELLYIDGWCDRFLASDFECRISGYPMISTCVCAACCIVPIGLGGYLCQLNNVFGYVFGSASIVSYSVCGFSYCFSKNHKKGYTNDSSTKISDINNKIQEMLGIKCIRDTEERVSMTVDYTFEAKEIHEDGCFFNTLVEII